ncbi:unnamed protein product [Owenia fusiformis]|uniref:Uncharacterized protein n=1 Tax=Owenia fusiformis TaxID=6347 RepID=A0A8J1UEL8_OWEFU|nr:unnamed protein product [Owenia fusiformis]
MGAGDRYITTTNEYFKTWNKAREKQQNAEESAVDVDSSDSSTSKQSSEHGDMSNKTDGDENENKIEFKTKRRRIVDFVKCCGCRAVDQLIRSWVVHPSDPGYYNWLAVISCAIMYNVFLIIARSVFWDLQEYYVHVWLPLDAISYILYILDVLVQFRTGYLEHGLMVTDFKKLAKHYTKTWTFKLDIISIIPFEIGYIWTGVNTPELRFNRLIKFTRLLEFFDRTLRRTNFPNLFRVFNLVFYIVIIVHWNACIYFAISNQMGFGVDKWVYPNISDPINRSLSRMYIYSFYWSSLTLLTIGETPHPEQDIQFLFVVFDYLIGVLIFASIVGNVGSMITNLNEARADFQRKLDSVKQYMDVRKVDPDLEKRVIKWFDYLWSNKQTLNEEAILSALPDTLRAELAIHIHLDTLKRVSIFQDCDPGLLVELVLKLKLSVYSPGDYICRKGDIGREMYIVKRGRLTVVGDDGSSVLASLQEGSVFGEVSVLNIVGAKSGNRRTANVRSQGYSDLFVLSKQDLWDTLKEYPDAKAKLIENGRNILMKHNLIDPEAEVKESQRKELATEQLGELEARFDVMQRQFSRLIGDYKATENKLKRRVAVLERAFKLQKTQLEPIANAD